MEKANEALKKKRLARKRALDARLIGLKNKRIQKMNVDNLLLKWSLISNVPSSSESEKVIKNEVNDEVNTPTTSSYNKNDNSTQKKTVCKNKLIQEIKMLQERIIDLEYTNENQSNQNLILKKNVNSVKVILINMLKKLNSFRLENHNLKRQVANFLLNSQNQDSTLNKILNIIRSEVSETNYKNFMEKLNQKFGFTINSTIKLITCKTIKVFNEVDLSTKKAMIDSNFNLKNINVLSSEWNIRRQKQNCSKLLTIETVTVKTKKGKELCVSRVSNIEKILKYKIIQLQKSNMFIEFIDNRFKDEIWFTLIVDKGSKTTKLGIILGNQNVVDIAKNCTMILIYEGDCEMSDVYAAFEYHASIISSITTININEKLWKIRWFISGNYEFLCVVMGREKVASKYPCLYCKWERKNEKNFSSFISEDSEARTSNDYVNINEEEGQIMKPLFKNIPHTQIIIPTLQIFFDLAKVVLEGIDAEINRIDLSNVSSDEIRFEMINKQDKLNKYINELIKEKAILINELKIANEDVEDMNAIIEGVGMHNDEKLQNEDCTGCSAEFCIEKSLGLVLISRSKDNLDDWILCDCHKNWFHTICAGLSSKQLKQLTTFYCDSIKNNGNFITKLKIILDEEKEKTKKIQCEYEICNNKLQLELIKMNEIIGSHRKKWQNSLASIGISTTTFFQEYNIDQIRIILKNIKKINNVLPNTPYIQIFNKCLTLLGKLQNYTYLRMLTTEEKTEFKKCIRNLTIHYATHLRELPETLKAHLLIKHAQEFLDRFNNIGYFAEQTIESLNSIVNKQLRRITARDTKTKQELLLKWNWRKNCSNDISSS